MRVFNWLSILFIENFYFKNSKILHLCVWEIQKRAVSSHTVHAKVWVSQSDHIRKMRSPYPESKQTRSGILNQGNTNRCYQCSIYNNKTIFNDEATIQMEGIKKLKEVLKRKLCFFGEPP